VIFVWGVVRPDAGQALPGRPGLQQRFAGGDDAFGDGRNLAGCLPLAEDDFRETLARGAVKVDSCEPDVLVRLLAQILKKPVLRSLRCKGAGPDVIEQDAQLLAVHRAK
jgi:hypothetical protein